MAVDHEHPVIAHNKGICASFDLCKIEVFLSFYAYPPIGTRLAHDDPEVRLLLLEVIENAEA